MTQAAATATTSPARVVNDSQRLVRLIRSPARKGTAGQAARLCPMGSEIGPPQFEATIRSDAAAATDWFRLPQVTLVPPEIVQLDQVVPLSNEM